MPAAKFANALFASIFCTAICQFASGFQPANAQMQTEYDGNLQQAQQNEETYRAQLRAEETQIEPYKERYIKQLNDLEKLEQSSHLAHGRNAKLNGQITSLTYWLKREDQKEASEDANLKNLDGWRIYWQSKQDSVVRTQAWNQEQIELDARAEQKKQLEAQAEAARNASYAAMVAHENQANNYSGGGYGGHGGHYHGGSFHSGGGHHR